MYPYYYRYPYYPYYPYSGYGFGVPFLLGYGFGLLSGYHRYYW